jgi:Na+/phosphate symporter
MTGVLCGAMFLISLTFLVGNSIVSAGQAAFGVVRGAAQAIPQLVPQGIVDDTQNMLRGIDRTDVQEAIRKAAPELGETQVAAATESVARIGRESVGRIRASLRNPRQMGDVLQSEADTVYRQLTGSEFVNRLEQQGLNNQQAQQVARSLEQRVNDLRSQLQNASQQISEEAREFTEEAAKALSKAARLWLGVALLVIGLAFLGGRNGSDQEGVEVRLREDEDVDQFRAQWTDRGEPSHPHH